MRIIMMMVAERAVEGRLQLPAGAAAASGLCSQLCSRGNAITCTRLACSPCDKETALGV